MRCPLCDAEYELHEAIPPKLIPVGVVATPQPARPVAPEIRVAHGNVRQTAEEEDEAATAVRTLVAASRLPRPPVPRSPLKTMVGIVLGGLLGCLVAYYGLAIYLGPDFKKRGLPELPLPFIAGLIDPQGNGGQREQPAKADDDTTGNAADRSDSAEPANVTNRSPAETSPPAETPDDAVDQKRPAPRPADYVGPRLSHTVTTEELAEALRKANAVSIATSDDPMPQAFYQSFCRLGEAVAFAGKPVENEELTELIGAAHALLMKVGDLPKRLDKIGQLANEQLGTQLPQNAGILLAGTVTDVTPLDRLWITTVQLNGQQTTVTVVSRGSMGVKAKDRLAVLGVVIHDPVANLVGYAGAQPLVVWSGVSVTLP